MLRSEFISLLSDGLAEGMIAECLLISQQALRLLIASDAEFTAAYEAGRAKVKAETAAILAASSSAYLRGWVYTADLPKVKRKRGKGRSPRNKLTQRIAEEQRIAEVKEGAEIGGAPLSSLRFPAPLRPLREPQNTPSDPPPTELIEIELYIVNGFMTSIDIPLWQREAILDFLQDYRELRTFFVPGLEPSPNVYLPLPGEECWSLAYLRGLPPEKRYRQPCARSPDTS